MGSPSLQETIGRIQRRLDELGPVRDEYVRLRSSLEQLVQEGLIAAKNLVGLGSDEPSARMDGRSTAAATRKASASTDGKTRADEILELVAAEPGLTVSQIAGRVGVRPNYLYRVTAKLEKDGRIRKDGKAFFIA